MLTALARFSAASALRSRSSASLAPFVDRLVGERGDLGDLGGCDDCGDLGGCGDCGGCGDLAAPEVCGASDMEPRRWCVGESSKGLEPPQTLPMMWYLERAKCRLLAAACRSARDIPRDHHSSWKIHY